MKEVGSTLMVYLSARERTFLKEILRKDIKFFPQDKNLEAKQDIIEKLKTHLNKARR